eukprot:GHUV01035227.1.p1 GENE.GHUV01035227.1~~GHUV01035227.1.p1  ORF type:complete len:360 (+),score=66.45 GHUV01035227.1:351-1430(+)
MEVLSVMVLCQLGPDTAAAAAHTAVYRTLDACLYHIFGKVTEPMQHQLPWGVGASFNLLFWSAAILKQLQPNTQIYYDHSPSPYQCSSNKTVEAVLQPRNNIIKTSHPPLECVKWGFLASVGFSYGFLSRGLKSIITETLRQDQKPITNLQQALERHLVLNDMLQSMCPIVDDWWHLTPQLQQRADAIKQRLQSTERPVIAIHARGGDKTKELGKYIDPDTHKYPMAEGMRRLIVTHPGIQASAPSCLILSDDYGYAQSVKAMAQDILKCREFVMRIPDDQDAAYEIKSFQHMPQKDRCEATKEYLIDIELMGWATFLISNHRANADTIAAFLRKCRFYHDMSTIVPGTGASTYTFWAG